MNRKKISVVKITSLAGLMLAVGCGTSGPELFTVQGKVELSGGDLNQFAGSTIEIARVGDDLIRGFGQVEPDGTFRLQSLIGGELREGVLEGQYRARIIPNDEDGTARQAATKQFDKQFLNYQSSGLELSVPAAGELQLSLKPSPGTGVRR